MGQGKNYAINFPLADGINDESYRSIFRPVIEKVLGLVPFEQERWIRSRVIFRSIFFWRVDHFERSIDCESKRDQGKPSLPLQITALLFPFSLHTLAVSTK